MTVGGGKGIGGQALFGKLTKRGGNREERTVEAFITGLDIGLGLPFEASADTSITAFDNGDFETPYLVD